jgi:hypothetical protein
LTLLLLDFVLNSGVYIVSPISHRSPRNPAAELRGDQSPAIRQKLDKAHYHVYRHPRDLPHPLGSYLTPTMTLSATLDGVPQEVLEQIAFFSATETFLGPPSILPLLLTNRKIHSWLSIRSNPTLYGRIFTSKFDIGAVVRRLGTERTNPQILADELQRRWHNLKRIRARSDSTVPSAEDDPSPCIRQLLFEAYFMILENEGKNEIQLREYAQMDQWLREYWFHEAGASRAISLLRTESWIPETQEMSLAMWIFWFMLRTGEQFLYIWEMIFIRSHT